MQSLQPASFSTGEICLGKYSLPAHTYVTRVIWVQAGMEGGRRSAHVYGDTLSDSWWPALTTHVANWPGTAHDPYKKKRKKKRRKASRVAGSLRQVLAVISVMTLAGCCLMSIQHSLKHNQNPLRLFRRFDWHEIGQQWLILTIVWDGACVCQRQ